ncbi:fiber protein Fb2-like [Oryza sativa Japonica Group]|uniref:Protein DEHYDRATION-INDUCED 19 homolog 3 n=2 Tax=Oryza sativa subsp. japonica TaxID=39947 RepID=DI193_ORYSJ|nr:protein DEHYDRATION-INDUCED 19 homolog 3 [Oryza sativa Japonica Group]Q5QMP3.1 RecName: Full=Protein DEHYDRATION-INDUCED 19 homolog 3; AltName: Full=OsDi19-3 [Oryza sativa Japonica Group]EEE55158.1 hypothetical protein OsJ_02966 [Oryza sativa Japonica Group]KAF2951606.1 hypothetical protein DAI22_01g274900 [Oryza sativa Japonica Group]BAD73302.1 fiber protein Fb2-like [Oryza sativa Japonica Group]BAD73355.1 fiber protein Fb2-like [Oryza sativa Japonica Group]BAF05742.1 Os01g0672400 [Oryza |eukprot:NP_001043828.1 Os01g0672400 [Oryza sativa Japonica Group]
MDSEHWISSLAAAKRFYAAQLGHVDDMAGIGMEEVEMEMEDDGEGMELELEMQLEEATWPDVACPYCYEDHDIASLCAHLEEDHPYEPHTSPCPICFEKITRDMLNHITMQHGYLFKSGRRMRRFDIPESQALSLLSRDLRDAQLQALLGGGHRQRRSNTTATNISADPLLSSFGLGFSTLDSEERSKAPVPIPDDTSIHKDTPAQPWESRIDSSLTSEEREQKRKQATDRATFVQGLVLSTLFED